jgi:putative zinc finger/helix-turn-helix YgiT family protein
MNTCPACGSSLERVSEPTEIPVGRASASVELAVDRCVSCGEEYVDPEVYSAAQAEAATAVRNQLGLLQPEEIRRIREQAGVTQEELEQLLGTGPKAVGRWERGTVLQSGMADKLLRVFQQCPGVLHQLLRDEAGGVLRKRLPSRDSESPLGEDPGPEPEVMTTTTYRLHVGEERQEGHFAEDMVVYAA